MKIKHIIIVLVTLGFTWMMVFYSNHNSVESRISYEMDGEARIYYHDLENKVIFYSVEDNFQMAKYYSYFDRLFFFDEITIAQGFSGKFFMVVTNFDNVDPIIWSVHGYKRENLSFDIRLFNDEIGKEIFLSSKVKDERASVYELGDQNKGLDFKEDDWYFDVTVYDENDDYIWNYDNVPLLKSMPMKVESSFTIEFNLW